MGRFQPGSTYETWTWSTDFVLTRVQGCYQPEGPICGIAEMPDDWRPLTVPGSEGSRVLFYGPGAVDDELFTPDGSGGFFRTQLTAGRPEFVPVVGEFNANGEQSVVWWRPGTEDDPLESLDGNAVLPDAGDGPLERYSFPVVGKFGFDGSDLDQVLWLNETQANVSFQADEDLELESQFLEVFNCGFPTEGHFHPVVGDLDADGVDELVLVSPRRFPSVVVWNDVTACFDFDEYFVDTGDLGTSTRGGDFDGNGYDDVLIYGHQNDPDFLMLFREGGADVVPLEQSEDVSPVARDFNGDGCTDILWHNGGDGHANVWASQCDGTFSDAGSWNAPKGAPVGH